MPKYFETGIVYVRRMKKESIEIIFWDKETIYVTDKTGVRHIFHRWFRERGSYGSGWSLFRQTLRERKSLDIWTIYELADKYDISFATGSSRKLNFKNKEVEYL